ncbi:MAG: bifunctional 5,10-methylenetetrahydrofolate dehydrogenase/5,10-methenyltetrahydrofolate cyclohydrolase [Candidatus Omnitrophica bacterium]|nr:bifunctional 5,10-methylenetetrahydrofolate dehydrogenase/5,10-methenyltetrahydrofolate cyclohydrolase [Candidatus Omnitrophota bacterium]
MIFEAHPLIIRLKRQLEHTRAGYRQVVLAALTIGEDRASAIYCASQKRMAEELKVEYRHYTFKKNVSAKKVLDALTALNADRGVHGIMVHKPLPGHLNEVELFSAIAPGKDIEGVHPQNVGRILLKDPYIIPPTAESVLAVLDHVKVDLYGKNVVLIGFSSHIGKPLSVILADKFATVTITHIGTYEKKQLPFYTRHADVLISCVGKPHFIKTAWIKKNAIVIDVGISRGPHGKICGDVDSQKAVLKAEIVTPVPLGVGALTPLFLYRNLFKSVTRAHQEKKRL